MAPFDMHSCSCPGTASKVAMALALLLALSACGDTGPSPEQLAEVAEPHLADFDGFDRWARRAMSADPAFVSRAALEEAVFAPLRRESNVWAGWAIANSGRSLSYGHLREVPKAIEWAVLRDPELGELSVATVKLGDPSRPQDQQGEPCVLIRRTQAGSDGAPVTVVLAFVQTSGEPVSAE